MIKINDIYFACELHDILVKLQMELHASGSRYLAKMKIGPTHIQVTCPYHSDGVERKPSAGIRKEDGLLHCFACGEVHSLPEVISHCFEKDDGGMYGMQWLLRNFSATAREENRNVKFDISRNKKTSDNNRLDIRANNYISNEELEKYRYVHPYILKRGVSEKIVELFDIGWDSKTDCITFPNLDKYGNCLFVAKRSVKQKFFQYPKDVQKELYGIYQLYQLDPFPSEVYVCESMIDCLYLWTFDIPACAMNGLGNEIQFKQLRELPCRQLILATDADEAGLRARERIRMNMQNTKIIKEVILPKGRKDINECTPNEIQNLVEVF
jgi:DNA primase